MFSTVPFCSVTVKRRSHFLRNFWQEKMYHTNVCVCVYVYKIYFISNGMGYCLFHARPLTHSLRNLQYTFLWAPLCYMRVYTMYTWFFHSFHSFLFFFLIHSNQPTFGYHLFCMCVRLRESVSSYASVCVLKHHINLSDKTVQLKGLLNLRERKKREETVFDWIVPITCFVTVLCDGYPVKWKQTVWHFKKIFYATYWFAAVIVFFHVISMIKWAAGILQQRKTCRWTRPAPSNHLNSNKKKIHHPSLWNGSSGGLNGIEPNA